jgi:membrane dipeptidase
VKEHWRNIDDDQIRAIAESGGVVGIMFEPGFLRAKGMKNDAGMVIAHLEHVIRVAGEDAPALGSDYDGFIIPPPDLRDGFAAFYRLAQRMLDARWSEARIRKILGLNYLRSFEHLRPA